MLEIGHEPHRPQCPAWVYSWMIKRWWIASFKIETSNAQQQFARISAMRRSIVTVSHTHTVSAITYNRRPPIIIHHHRCSYETARMQRRTISMTSRLPFDVISQNKLPFSVCTYRFDVHVSHLMNEFGEHRRQTMHSRLTHSLSVTHWTQLFLVPFQFYFYLLYYDHWRDLLMFTFRFDAAKFERISISVIAALQRRLPRWRSFSEMLYGGRHTIKYESALAYRHTGLYTIGQKLQAPFVLHFLFFLLPEAGALFIFILFSDASMECVPRMFHKITLKVTRFSANFFFWPRLSRWQHSI